MLFKITASVLIIFFIFVVWCLLKAGSDNDNF